MTTTRRQELTFASVSCLADALPIVRAVTDSLYRSRMDVEANALFQVMRWVEAEVSPFDTPEYAAFVAECAKTCEADDKPCDSCLAGGICDGPDPDWLRDLRDSLPDDDDDE